jgi:hemolysin III
MYWLGFREPISSWTHGFWMLCAVPGCLVLWRACGCDRAKQIGLLLFGASLVCCFGGSSLYHGVCLPPPQIEICRIIDHIGIFLLILGTITPLALVLLTGRWRILTLALAWGSASLGIVLLVTWPDAPSWLHTVIYLTIGWVISVGYFEMARVLPSGAMRSLFVGGLFYTIGAILNLTGWPTLFPQVFGTHEVFHLFVMAGSLCHFWFMVRWVAPFDRRRIAAATRTIPAPAIQPAADLAM